MKKMIYRLFLLAAICVLLAFLVGASASKKDSNLIESCSADFNADGKTDTCLMLENEKTLDVVVMMNEGTKYTLYVLDNRSKKWPSVIKCKDAFPIKETKIIDNVNRKTINPIGSVIVVSNPEGAAEAFYWDKNKFSSIWIRD